MCVFLIGIGLIFVIFSYNVRNLCVLYGNICICLYIGFCFVALCNDVGDFY